MKRYFLLCALLFNCMTFGAMHPLIPLFVEITHGNSDAVQASIDRGVPINTMIDGRCPLSHAIQLHKNTIAQLLLSHNANANLSNNANESPLYFAVLFLNIEGVELLLNHGANPFTTDKTDTSPYEYAVHFIESPSSDLQEKEKAKQILKLFMKHATCKLNTATYLRMRELGFPRRPKAISLQKIKEWLT